MAVTHVFRWDLDKTYLRSEFETMADLIKSALESALEKQAYPGATALLRSLRQGEGHRICIISGSPTQMRRVLSAKLTLDGVKFDEFILKNNLRNLMRGRFRALRSQVPYKLPSLLASRVALNTTPPETLFGDDAEADAIVYSLYADLIAGKIPIDELERILQAARAYEDEIALTLTLAKKLIYHDSVQRILIHLDRRSPTAHFQRYGRRLVPIYNYFQAALVLYADGQLSARQVLFVALDMLDSKEYELTTLANSLQDLVRRGRISLEIASKLAAEAREASDAVGRHHNLPPFDEIARAFSSRITQLGGTSGSQWEAPPPEPSLDYVSLVDAEHQERRMRKRTRRRRIRR